MRRSVTLAVAVVAVAAADARAYADSCTGETDNGGRFATCFDAGNRLSITTGTDGFGGSLALRHVITFDDEPDLVWKLEHVAADITHSFVEDRFSAVLYRGHYIRHARDGHIVLPVGAHLKKVFLPFDIGAFAEVGKVSWEPDTTISRIGVVKMAALFDLSRTRTFHRRIAFGPVARWDVDLDRSERQLAQHIVSPFTSAMLELKGESADGLWLGNLTLEGGTAWRNKLGWEKSAAAEVSAERILLAVNDRPIAVFAGARYDSVADELTARVGARVVLVHRRDARVRLEKPRVSQR